LSLTCENSAGKKARYGGRHDALCVLRTNQRLSRQRKYNKTLAVAAHNEMARQRVGRARGFYQRPIGDWSAGDRLLGVARRVVKLIISAIELTPARTGQASMLKEADRRPIGTVFATGFVFTSVRLKVLCIELCSGLVNVMVKMLIPMEKRDIRICHVADSIALTCT